MSVEKKVLNMAPQGKKFPKICLPEIAREAGCDYVATVSSANPKRIQNAVRQAVLTAREIGPSYIQIFSPCPTNFKFKSNETVAVAKAREKDGTYRMIEYVSDNASSFLKQLKEEEHEKCN